MWISSREMLAKDRKRGCLCHGPQFNARDHRTKCIQ
ncbi:hypothetical protein Goshw_022826 [Gossypium schwendimanii]|uniref:Uncharacterized protein n=1 Tax=Gossypium schwendimanii TaxID=34291 RepID=A0A7J9M731_GOSSC|nr:hypothetical protein [Gossypium schwendimanii]